MSTPEEVQRVRTLLALSLNRRWLPDGAWNLTPEELTVEIRALANVQGNAFEQAISATLKHTGALLAGGSVLSAVNNTTPSYLGALGNRLQDLDFYVNVSQAKYLISVLLSFGYHFYTQDLITSPVRGALNWKDKSSFVLAPSYDQSFFRKNHIMARIPFTPMHEILKVGDEVWAHFPGRMGLRPGKIEAIHNSYRGGYGQRYTVYFDNGKKTE